MSTLLSQIVGVSGAIQSNQIPLEILLVGGGGGGSGYDGGSAGQVVWYKQYVITKGTTYNVVIGNGGNGGISTGGQTTFGSLIAYGANLGGSGNNIIPSIITSDYIQLSNSRGNTSNLTGSGGGGAGGVGLDGIYGSNYSGGDGGAGYITYISGISSSFAGGGGGSNFGGAGSKYGIGKAGGGSATSGSGNNATPNTGSGGGGSSTGVGAAGGSGIIILAYPDTYTTPVSSVGITTLTTRPGYRVYQFTGATGSVTW